MSLNEPSGGGPPESAEACDGYVEVVLYPYYPVESGFYSGTGDHVGQINGGPNPYCGLQGGDVYSFTGDELTVELRPRVAINPFEAVGKGTTAEVEVEVTPEENQTPITLSLRRLQGTGEARFAQNNGTSITITQTETIEISGVTESSVKNNYIIEAKLNNKLLASDTFSVA